MLKLGTEWIQNGQCRRGLLVGGAFVLCSFMLLAADDWVLCERELHSYYVPMETRRGFNAMESRGFVYRLRLVVELTPERNVLDATGSASSGEYVAELGTLKHDLKKCLSCQPSKGLLEKAIQEHRPGSEPSELLTNAFGKGLQKCLDGQVPETFDLSIDLYCDRKVTDWR